MAEDWRDKASCLGRDPEIWFPHPSDREAVAKAEAICTYCPVVDECRKLARSYRVQHGVWAGSLRERSEEEPCPTVM